MTDTSAVANWYDQNADTEHRRLELFGLEFAISLRAITRCIDTIQRERNLKTLQILDLGGGTGRYAVELARQGHAVHYTDLSPAEVERGIAYAEAEGVRLASAAAVDALALERDAELYGREKYDLVLCMGPLYHLLRAEEREKAVESCAYVVRPGGYVCVAFVTKWAHLRDLARRDPGRVVREEGFYDGYAGEGDRGGVYDRVEGRTGWHVGSGKEARAVVEGVRGLVVEWVVACEGFLGGGLSAGLGQDNRAAFLRWADLCWQVSEQEEMLGASDHLLVAARKPAE